MRRIHSRYAVVLVTLLICQPLFPATIEVNETCTLVDAINAANNDDDSGGLCPPGGSGADTLVLTEDVLLTSGYGTDDFGETAVVVGTEITIEGGGFTIERDEAAAPFRIFTVAFGTLRLKDVTVRNGWATDTASGLGDVGGAVLFYNAVLNLNRAELSGNRANGGGAVFAYYSGGTVTDSSISNNSALGSGGGIRIVEGNIGVTNSTISDNAADLLGGGIAQFRGNLTIVNSTISGNTASLRGGGLSGFAGDTAYEIDTELEHCTLSGNSAPEGGGIWMERHRVRLIGTIVANSPAGGNCDAPEEEESNFDVLAGSNFADDASCGADGSITAGVDFDTTLADNGGPTATHALLAGSVARDDAGGCRLETDQRGVARTDGECDSGSFELVEGACCTDAPGVASDCIVTDQSVCEVRGGLFLGIGSECRPDIDCVALLVTMEAMSAVAVPQGVVVRWTTAMETDTVGFQVLRQSRGRREKALQPVGPMVPAFGSEVEGASYEVLDDSPAAAGAIHYFIEDIDLFGKVTRHGPIAVDRGVRDRRAVRVAPHL